MLNKEIYFNKKYNFYKYINLSLYSLINYGTSILNMYSSQKE